MRLRDLLALCDQISPFELQESWDNSGLIIGDPDQAIGEVVCALEADEGVIAAAPENATLLVHHPLIFGALKRLDFSTYPANLIQKILHKNLSLIALHTNFDKTHLNRFVAEEILGWQNFTCEGHLCLTETTVGFEALLQRVKTKLHPNPRLLRPTREVRRVALCTGSGASLLDGDKFDCLLTGDIKYHDAMAARSLGVGLIDIGHYESERYFGAILVDALKANGITAIMADSENPFLAP